MCSLAAFALLIIGVCVGAHARYLGRELGALRELHHGVRGRVFAVDARTLFLQDFHYDGEGPAAYFYVGTSKTPSAAGGIRLRDERGGSTPLRRYRGESVTLSLPDGKTLRDVKWFAVWCDEYAINFGDVSIPRDLEYPKPARVGALRGVHGVSSDAVVVVDAQTLLVPNFSYDGEAPDAKFWVGRGAQPSPQGIRIPDENGKEAPLRRYDRKTIVLTLPGELTVFDIGHFAVWCEAFTVNFGHVPLPRAALANVPPSLKMLGVSPQSRNAALVADASPARPRPHPRPAIAHQDATTYRPPRLGAGPLAALLDQPADHAAHLHRRANDYTPPKEQQVEIQPSKEVYYQNYQPHQDYERPQQQDYQQQAQYYQQQQQQPTYQTQEQQYDTQNAQQQYQQNAQQQHPNEQQQYQQQNEQYQQNDQYRQNDQQKQYPNEQQYQQNDQQYRQQNEQYYQNEQQLYEQQKAAYERQLQEESYSQQQRQQEPVQYRLLPYSYERGRRQAGRSDLDLVEDARSRAH